MKKEKIKVNILHCFPTQIYACEQGFTHMNSRIEKLAHNLKKKNVKGAAKLNIGGWHSHGRLIFLDPRGAATQKSRRKNIYLF